jgi:hypothetical protein
MCYSLAEDILSTKAMYKTMVIEQIWVDKSRKVVAIEKNNLTEGKNYYNILQRCIIIIIIIIILLLSCPHSLSRSLSRLSLSACYYYLSLYGGAGIRQQGQSTKIMTMTKKWIIMTFL